MTLAHAFAQPRTHLGTQQRVLRALKWPTKHLCDILFFFFLGALDSYIYIYIFFLVLRLSFGFFAFFKRYGVDSLDRDLHPRGGRDAPHEGETTRAHRRGKRRKVHENKRDTITNFVLVCFEKTKKILNSFRFSHIGIFLISQVNIDTEFLCVLWLIFLLIHPSRVSDAVRAYARSFVVFSLSAHTETVEMLKNHLTDVTDEETAANGRVFSERLRVN